MTSQAVATIDNDQLAVLEKVIADGDLKNLSAGERLDYYGRVCSSVGLNPFTRPFEYLVLNGKTILYARKDCTDQLRTIHSVSVRIVAREALEDCYIVTAAASMPSGRVDESTGAVPLPASGEARANAMMKAECVPLDSEILTRDGFKRFDALIIGEDVLAYDTETDTTRWTPLEAVSVYDDAPVVRLHSPAGQFDVLCTPNHSWAVAAEPYRARSNGSRKVRGPYANRRSVRRLVEASQIVAGERVILAAPEIATTDSLLTPAEAAILGWAVTDGTIKRVGNSVRLGICQSKVENFAGIRELVGAAKELVSPARTRTFPTGRTYDTQEQHWWYLPSAISREILDRAGFTDRTDLPRIATRLSSSARKAMLQAFMLAEGDAGGTFYNGDASINEAFQILCALEGIASGRQVPHLTISRQRMKTTRHVAGRFLNTTDAGSQPVWCPTTALGTWVMRQNGRAMITGNTKAKRRVTLSICGLGFLDESETESIPGAIRVDVEGAPTSSPPSNPPYDPALDDDGRKRFWARSRELGHESVTSVHRALGLAPDKGALTAWLQSGHSWAEALADLEASVAAEPDEPDAPDEITAIVHCDACGYQLDECNCGAASGPKAEAGEQGEMITGGRPYH